MGDRQGDMKTVDGSETSVRQSVVVEVERAHAFGVFTDGFDSWWNRSHHLGEAELDEAIIEPCEGGRWYERGVDGSECDWGTVISWEPPDRIVLAWQINSEWRYDPDLVTEVEVTFTEMGASRTRVDLEHRNLDRFGDAAARMRAEFGSDGGWRGLLRLYAEQSRVLGRANEERDGRN